MKPKTFFYIGLAAGLLLIICCFFPWAFYKTAGVSFNGVNAVRFATGTYYGKPGYFIIPLTIILMICNLTPKIFAKRIALFLGAVLVAYVLRTYVVFTAGFVQDDVETYFAMYAVVLLSFIILASTLFPYLPAKENKNALASTKS